MSRNHCFRTSQWKTSYIQRQTGSSKEKNPCSKLSRVSTTQNAILKNLSEEDICFDSIDLIDLEGNAVDLYDQRDSKGQMLFTSFKIWNILDKLFVQIHVQLYLLSTIQQLQQYSIVFRYVLASHWISVEEGTTYNPLIYYENFLDIYNSLIYMTVWWEGRLGNRMPSKDQDRSRQGLYDWRSKVCQWMLCIIPRLTPSMPWIISKCCWNWQENQNISASNWWVCEGHDDETSWWNHGQGSHCRLIWQITSNEGNWGLEI